MEFESQSKSVETCLFKSTGQPAGAKLSGTAGRSCHLQDVPCNDPICTQALPLLCRLHVQPPPQLPLPPNLTMPPFPSLIFTTPCEVGIIMATIKKRLNE